MMWRDELRALIKKMDDDGRREMDERCIGWLVVSRDMEYGDIYITGPYEDRAAAERAALRDGGQLNDGLAEGDLGWELTVHRLMPA